MAASNANTKMDAMTATTIITVFEMPPFDGKFDDPAPDVCSDLALAVELEPEPESELALVGVAGWEPPELIVLPVVLLPV